MSGSPHRIPTHCPETDATYYTVCLLSNSRVIFKIKQEMLLISEALIARRSQGGQFKMEELLTNALSRSSSRALAAKTCELFQDTCEINLITNYTTSNSKTPLGFPSGHPYLLATDNRT